MDRSQYLIDTLGQLVDAKKETQVICEQLVRSEDSCKSLVERVKVVEEDSVSLRRQLEQSARLESQLEATTDELNRLKLSTQDKDEQVQGEIRRLRDRNSKLESEKQTTVLQALTENIRIMDQFNVLRVADESSKRNAAALQQKVDQLAQSLRGAGEDKEKLVRELQMSRAAAQIPRVEVGVNTDQPSISKPNGTNLYLSVGRGASTTRPRAPRATAKPEAVSNASDATTRIPAARMEPFATVPCVVPDLSDNGSTCFSRPFLSQHLGGSSRHLFVQIAITNQKKFAIDHHLSGYFCPTLWEHPWCPTGPGMAGYMFVGLGDDQKFVRPEIHNLFVGVTRARYRLMGRYEAHRVEPLTIAEWKTLPEKVQSKYCETTQRKCKDSRSIQDINKAYASGELRVPCVKLTCLDFNENLYKSLIKAQKSYNPFSPQRSSQHEYSTRSPQKRRRTKHDSGSEYDFSMYISD